MEQYIVEVNQRNFSPLSVISSNLYNVQLIIAFQRADGVKYRNSFMTIPMTGPINISNKLIIG